MELLNAHTLFIIFGALLDLVCIIAVIFVERKNPASTIAWILVLIFVPFFGFLAYVMFGSGFHINKRKRYALKQISDNIYKRLISRHLENCRTCEVTDAALPKRMIEYLEKDGGHYYTADNDARLFTDGGELFAAMKDDMRAAQEHIHLLYYIFRNDVLGREILDILCERARNGVEVRLIYDSLGSLFYSKRIFKKLRLAGGRVEPFSPLLFTLGSHLRLNYRNHRKITVIDGRIGYVGGMNIGVEYMGQNKRLSPWRDTHLRLTGSAASFLQERFLLDWMSVTDREKTPEELCRYFPAPLRKGTLGMQIVSGGPDTTVNAIKSGFLEMVYAARERVYIQTPYFSPDDSLIDALRIAAGSGVDVRLMLPGVPDHRFVHGASLSYARLVLGRGVRIFLYQGFLHAKTIVVDGRMASIGTANFGHRSFALNFEVNAFFYSPGFAAACERVFLADQRMCSELSEDWFRNRPLVLRASQSICRIFSPLI